MPHLDHPVPLTDLVAACRELSAEAFAEEYGDGFLLLAVPDAGLVPPSKPWRSTVMDTGRRAGATDVQAVVGGMTVFSVRYTGRSASSSFVTVGRAGTNDIVLADESVSGFHAFFQQAPGGGYRLQDAGSRNGTFVGDTAVPQEGEGEAMPVEAGDEVRFGAVALTFVGVAELKALTARLE